MPSALPRHCSSLTSSNSPESSNGTLIADEDHQLPAGEIFADVAAADRPGGQQASPEELFRSGQSVVAVPAAGS